MRVYRRLQVMLVAVLVGYVVLAVAEVAGGEKGSSFPVFSWALFEKVPNRTTHYRAVVRSLDGRELNPARDLLDLEPFLPGGSSLHVRTIVHDLGEAISANDEDGVIEARHALEHVRMRGRRLRYEIEGRTYDDPREVWHGRAPTSVLTLGAFTTEGQGR